MGKRSDFERIERDFYPTPYEAIIPLLPFLTINQTFAEPCAGDGRLIKHLERHHQKCVYACDIEPQADGIVQADVLFFNHTFPPCDKIITNPPWEREALHPMIDRFAAHADTWLLFDADWMHTIQASPFASLCKRIVSVGRVKWIEGSKNGGMDNACWYEFSKRDGRTEFYFR